MKKLTFFILLLSLFAACKKKDKTCTQDMAGISGTHKITAVTYKVSASAAEQDYFNILYPDACERDDVFILSANGTYTLTDAGVACSPPGGDTGTWNVSGNTATFDGEATIIEVYNCSTLTILLADFDVPGDEIKYTFTRQ